MACPQAEVRNLSYYIDFLQVRIHVELALEIAGQGLDTEIVLLCIGH